MHQMILTKIDSYEKTDNIEYQWASKLFKQIKPNLDFINAKWTGKILLIMQLGNFLVASVWLPNLENMYKNQH